MLILPDRRDRKERRGPAKVEESLERKAPRRRGDRRDSPRVPRIILVREAGSGGEYEKSPGDLSLGGCRWRSEHFPESRQVELCIRVPGYARPVQARAEVIRVELLADELELHATFTEIDVKAELAIARYLESRQQLSGSDA